MRNHLIIIILVLLTSCKEENVGFQGKLTNGDIIQVVDYILPLGATTPDVMWVIKKSGKGEGVFIARLDNVNTKIYKVDLTQLNDSTVFIRLTDKSTGMFKGAYFDYKIDLNKRIYPNDGSPGVERINH